MAVFHVMEARQHLKADISVRLYIGMTGESGLDIASHRAFESAVAALTGAWFRVAYAPRGFADHSKLYVWRRQGVAVRAWTGSANYTLSGFGLANARRKETLTDVDARAAEDVIARAADRFVSFDDPNLGQKVDVYREVTAAVREPIAELASAIVTPPDTPNVRLPLVQTVRMPGEVHNPGAGLNWGQRGTRRRAEAYIPVPAAIARAGFFPSRGIPFAVHTTDGDVLFMTTAQDGEKALHSVPDNAQIGLYFRRRLGLDSEAPIRTANLEQFGSKHVTVWRRSNGSYVMDFSPQIAT